MNINKKKLYSIPPVKLMKYFGNDMLVRGRKNNTDG